MHFQLFLIILVPDRTPGRLGPWTCPAVSWSRREPSAQPQRAIRKHFLLENLACGPGANLDCKALLFLSSSFNPPRFACSSSGLFRHMCLVFSRFSNTIPVFQLPPSKQMSKFKLIQNIERRMAAVTVNFLHSMELGMYVILPSSNPTVALWPDRSDGHLLIQHEFGGRLEPQGG